jgi:hypothetical protein
MIAILLIFFIVLLFAALPTWPYSASGRARYHVAPEGTARAAAKLPQSSSGKALHTVAEDHASQFRDLQNELQRALDRTARSSEIAKPREAACSGDSREQQAA